MRNRLAAFMTKGAPLAIMKEDREKLLSDPEERKKRVAEAKIKRRLSASSSVASEASLERLAVKQPPHQPPSTPRPPHQPRAAVAMKSVEVGEETERKGFRVEIARMS